ncbi:hypothetical protein BH09BAC6_BH09BAC6_26430 [soil metagenome]
MDTYYTIEEKYLQAVDEVRYGEAPKGLQLLNSIINDDPFYARAHFQLGKIFYYETQDYQTAGYHFKTCMELEPSFPDNYFDYLNMVVFLNMEKQVHQIAAQALVTPGVCHCCIYNLMGLFYEKNKNWTASLDAYQNALMEVTLKDESTDMEESIARVKQKKLKSKAYNYIIV